MAEKSNYNMVHTIKSLRRIEGCYCYIGRAYIGPTQSCHAE